MIGLKCKWSCPSCGNILKTENPFWTKKQRKDIQEPSRCGCGRKADFNLLKLEQCEFNLVKDFKEE